MRIFVGHPLLDAISDLPEISVENFKKENGLNEKKLLHFYPVLEAGSRKMLALMLSVARFF